MSTEKVEDPEEISRSRGAGATAETGANVGVDGSECVLLKSGKGGTAEDGSAGGRDGEEA